MSNKNYSSMEESFGETIPEFEMIEVTNCMKLNVRDYPGITGNVIDVLNQGSILEKVKGADKNGFSKVRLTNGKSGYVMSKYIKVI